MNLPSLQLHKAHFPVTTLGWGRRVGVWFQGCSIRCDGCINRDTWPADGGASIPVHVLMAQLEHWLRQADGVTLTGGEPFDQPVPLLELIRSLRCAFAGDILAYSGYPIKKLKRDFGPILAEIDVLISEPFHPDHGQNLWLRGSDNQRIHLLSGLARQRYPADMDKQPWPVDRRLDVSISDNEIWMVGIPRPGDMERLRHRLLKAGYWIRTSDQTTPEDAKPIAVESTAAETKEHTHLC